jgi:hypothetical protein
MTNLYYANRAQAAYAAAEAHDDPRDKAAFRAAARTWERLAQPATGVTYSMEPSRLQMAALKRDVAEGIVRANEPECGFSSEGYREDVTVIAKGPTVPPREEVEEFFCTRYAVKKPTTIDF